METERFRWQLDRFNYINIWQVPYYTRAFLKTYRYIVTLVTKFVRPYLFRKADNTLGVLREIYSLKILQFVFIFPKYIEPRFVIITTSGTEVTEKELLMLWTEEIKSVN